MMNRFQKVHQTFYNAPTVVQPYQTISKTHREFYDDGELLYSVGQYKLTQKNFEEAAKASDKELRILAQIGLAKIAYKQNSKQKGDAIFTDLITKEYNGKLSEEDRFRLYLKYYQCQIDGYQKLDIDSIINQLSMWEITQKNMIKKYQFQFLLTQAKAYKRKYLSSKYQYHRFTQIYQKLSVMKSSPSLLLKGLRMNIRPDLDDLRMASDKAEAMKYLKTAEDFTARAIINYKYYAEANNPHSYNLVLLNPKDIQESQNYAKTRNQKIISSVQSDIQNAIKCNPKYVLTLHLKKKLVNSWSYDNKASPFDNIFDLKSLYAKAIQQDAKYVFELLRFEFPQIFQKHQLVNFCETLIHQNPQDAYTTYIRIGKLWKKRGELEDALNFLQKATKIDGKRSEGHQEMGHILYLMNRTEETLKSYGQAIKCGSKCIEVYLNCGRILNKCQQPQQAKEMYQRVIEIQPNHKEARDQLTMLQQPSIKSLSRSSSSISSQFSDLNLDN